MVIGDLASRQDSDRMVDETLETFNGLDILVHNAGIDAPGPEPAGETSDDL